MIITTNIIGIINIVLNILVILIITTILLFLNIIINNLIIFKLGKGKTLCHHCQDCYQRWKSVSLVGNLWLGKCLIKLS